MKNELVIILDFGGQYNQLIARRVREHNVYCEVLKYTTSIDELKKLNPKGIIFTGGPNSVYAENAPLIDKAVFELGIPVLGICYGMQAMSYLLGGSVGKAGAQEYGQTLVTTKSSPLFKGIPETSICWMSHTDSVTELPAGFHNIASSANCPNAAMANDDKKLYGVQFHPEVLHTEYGKNLLHNFLFEICCCTGQWTMEDFVVSAIEKLKEEIGDKRVLLALSGGVDSAVCAAMLSKAIGNQLTCIYVNHGFMRKNETEEIIAAFKDQDLNLIPVDASARFLDKLRGVTDPEQKRKIIGREFIEVFKEESSKLGKLDYFAQGTIYPDVIESGLGDAAVIKSHHNVGGLPKELGFDKLIEPLRLLFKDEVRAAGTALGLPDSLVWRQPFPGPGLAVRVIGQITKEKLDLLREADAILREEIAAAGLSRQINQYFAVLTDMRSVGVMGDERTYDYTLALRAVTTTDFMTADWAKIPHNVLEKISSRIINEVSNINRIVYDITTKPPATIEWE